ncbi:MAG: hypothetical protein GXO47_10545 [Chlorobi bacterium]|nr:hypothetical protein [Chlorobiota bacterium]
MVVLKGNILYTGLSLINLILLLTYPTSSEAKDHKFYFRHITTEQGLSQVVTSSLAKDGDGFIWVSTPSGLNRFNGYETTLFKHDNNDKTSLSNDHIKVLFSDRDGTLWIGTYNGLNKYNPEHENFKRYTYFEDNNSLEIPVYTILQDNNGDIWYGTWGYGLFKIDIKTDSVYQYDLSRIPGLSHESNVIANICIKDNNTLYISTWGAGMIKFNTKTGYIKQYKNNPDDPKSIPLNKVSSVIKASENNFLVALQDGLLYSFNPKTETFKPVNKINRFTAGKESFINKMITGHDGNIWIAVYGGGVYIYNANNDSIINHIEKERDNSASLSSNLVTDILFTKDDGLTWIATVNGINVYSPYVPRFKTFDYKDLPDSILEFNTQNFIYLDKCKICIGTRNYGIWEFNPTNNSFIQDNQHHTPALLSNNIMSLTDDINNVFIGTNIGLCMIKRETGEVIKFKDRYINHTPIKCLLPDSSGFLWVGTFNGLVLLDTKNGKTEKFYPYPTNINTPKNVILSIDRDFENNLWIGTNEGGLCKFDVKRKKFTQIITYNKDNPKNGLSDNYVYTVFVDSDDNIWTGTRNGLNFFNPHTNAFRHLGKENGLKSTDVFSIIEDKNNNIWFSSGESLVKLSLHTWEYKLFDNFDGISTSSFNSNAALKLPSGYLLFGGINGFNYFHPDSIRMNTFLPKLKLCNIKILNQPIKEYQKKNHRKILHRSPIYTQRLNLNHYENSLTFTFTALNYNIPEKNTYSYMLEGFDDNWIFNGTKRTATYTNIPPGTYKFKVKATNNDNYWSNHEISLIIDIKPPFYQTIWFITSVILLILILIFSYNKYKTYKLEKQKSVLEKVVREKTMELMEANAYLEEKQEEIKVQNEKIINQKNKLEKHKDELEKLVKDRTKDLEIAKEKAERSEKLKTAFLANMSHEIRTPMNAIIGFSTLLNTPEITKEEQEKYIEYIKENSEALLVLIDDILDISQIESGNIYIRKENFIIKDVVSSVVENYKIKYHYRNIKIIENYSAAEAYSEIYSDPERIKQVMRNLMENAYKFMENGTIETGITGYTENGKKFVKVYVSDTGPGIPEELKEIIFDRFRKVEMKTEKHHSGVGLGLAISKKIIEHLGGRIWVESEVGVYSKFIFILPLNNND